MVHTNTLAFAAAAVLAAAPVNAGLYPRGSAVTSINGKTFDSLIKNSNYTSIVEFYAPWCGHCKNLQPAYEKAAKSLQGLAKVAAVDCDEESNKQFCGSMGVQGFPTLKIVRPGSKPGKPVIEDYNGPRTAKGIVEIVTDKINNHVKKVEDKNLENWLATANETAKAILFTDKGKTSALLKAVAIDFKGSIEVAQIRNTQKASVELFGVSKYPTLILLPGGKEAQGIVYDGELKKDAIVKFLSQAATPNPDPAPAKPKAKATKSKAPKEKASSAKAEEAAAKDTETSPADATETAAEDGSEEATATKQKEEPTVAPAPPIPLIESDKELIRECLGPKTGTCILAVLPKNPNDVVLKVIQTLSEIHYKNFRSGRKIFPFYALPPMVTKQAELVEKLGLDPEVDIIAINGRRGWYRRIARAGKLIEASDVSESILESWIENIKLGEGKKEKIPAGLIEEVEEGPFVPDEEPVVPVEEAAAPSEEPVAVPSDAEEIVKEGEPIEAEGAEKVTEPIAEVHDEL